MSLDTALFLVDRDGINYQVSGADIGTRIKTNDKVLVQRDGERFHCAYVNSDWDKIRNDDLLLAWDGTENRMVTGQNFKGLFSKIPGFPAGFEVVAEHPDGNTDFWFTHQDIIALKFYGKEPGTTEQDYLDAYDVETIIEDQAANYLTLYTDVIHTPQWVVYSTRQSIASLLPVTVKTQWTNKEDPTDVHTFSTVISLSKV